MAPSTSIYLIINKKETKKNVSLVLLIGFRGSRLNQGLLGAAKMCDALVPIGQEELVSCSSDYSTRWLAIK
jgi:hypothetical protein